MQKGKKKMSDLISRDLAIKTMMALEAEDIADYGCSIPEGFDGKRASDALMKIPSAQTKIIRCKDCKHFWFAHNRVPEEQEWVCGIWGVSRGEDDYCSEAKARR